jgi:hypothetical protein
MAILSDLSGPSHSGDNKRKRPALSSSDESEKEEEEGEAEEEPAEKVGKVAGDQEGLDALWKEDAEKDGEKEENVVVVVEKEAEEEILTTEAGRPNTVRQNVQEEAEKDGEKEKNVVVVVEEETEVVDTEALDSLAHNLEQILSIFHLRQREEHSGLIKSYLQEHIKKMLRPEEVDNSMVGRPSLLTFVAVPPPRDAEAVTGDQEGLDALWKENLEILSQNE